MAGEFEQLLPFKWRQLHLPILRVGLSLAHDLVEHKYWGVNGARVEATGVAPIRISAVIPIANSIFPGKNEKWAAGGLYPDALRKFIIEFAKKETGYVQHPEFGEIACKPERMEFELAGEKQDCTEIRASWVETLDDEVLHKLVPSPVQDIELAASDLAASGADLRKLAPQLPEFQESLESLGRKLTALVDTVSILQYRGAGLVNRILYQAHRLEVAIKRASSNQLGQITSLRPFQSTFKDALKAMKKLRPNSTTVGTGPVASNSRPQQQALTWPAIQSLQQVKASAYSLRRAILTQGGVGLYTTPAQTTVAGVILSLPRGTSVADVIKMNPSLARGPVVSKGTVIRYPLPQ